VSDNSIRKWLKIIEKSNQLKLKDKQDKIYEVEPCFLLKEG
jgi:hypothetical protein